MTRKNKKHDYAAFILTHRRPDRVWTYEALRKHGYTGPIYLLVDDTDPTIDEYKERYGDEVIVFPKKEAYNITDTMDNNPKMNVVVFARNYIYKVVEQLGYKKFLELDDDYIRFSLAFLRFGEKKEIPIRNLDKVFEIVWNYMDKTPFKTLAFAQGGDFIGGGKQQVKKGFKRKAMNLFFCRTDRPLEFKGRLNEDVNMYVLEGLRGGLVGTITHLKLQQMLTQHNAGGLTDAYLDVGTYVKSFYSVMISPAAVKITVLKQKNWRIHHKVRWEHTAVKIIPEKYKRR